MWISLEPNKLATRETLLVGLSRVNEIDSNCGYCGKLKSIVAHHGWPIVYSRMAKTKTFQLWCRLLMVISNSSFLSFSPFFFSANKWGASMPKQLKNVLEKGNFGNSKEPQGHPRTSYRSRYSRMDQVNFFKGCLPNFTRSILEYLDSYKHFKYIEFKSCVHWNSKLVKIYEKSSKTTCEWVYFI